MGHQRADRGGGGVELVNFMLFAHGPEPARIGPCRHAFEHQRRRTIGQGTIDDIAVPRHPAHIGRAPEDVAVMVVEGVLMRHRGIDQIAARGMHHALGLPGRTRGVEDEERVFRRHFGRGAIVIRLHRHLVVIEVAPVHPCGLPAGAAHHQAFHAILAMQQGRVGVGLERGRAPAARGVIGGDHHLGVAAVDPRAQCIGREAGKDDGMHGPDARAGQHGIGGLGDHRQIDHDAVAFAHAHGFQDIGHPAGAAVQFLVGDVLRLILGVIGFPDDRGLIAARGQMPVDAIGADVQRAILEPFDVHCAGREAGVLDLRIGFDPVDPLAMLCPEPLGILDRGVIHRLVAVGGDMGLCRKGGRRGIECLGAGRVGHESSVRMRGPEGPVTRPSIGHGVLSSGGNLPQRCHFCIRYCFLLFNL